MREGGRGYSLRYWIDECMLRRPRAEPCQNGRKEPGDLSGAVARPLTLQDMPVPDRGGPYSVCTPGREKTSRQCATSRFNRAAKSARVPPTTS